MGVADTLRVIERASVTSGAVTDDEFRTLLDTYTAMQRKRDPLAAIGAHFATPLAVTLTVVRRPCPRAFTPS